MLPKTWMDRSVCRSCFLLFGGGGGEALQVSGLEGYQLNVGVDLEKYGDNNSSRLFSP